VPLLPGQVDSADDPKSDCNLGGAESAESTCSGPSAAVAELESETG
jgi:hypothetical protein